MVISMIIRLIATYANINVLLATPPLLIAFPVKVQTELLGAQLINFVRKLIKKLIYFNSCKIGFIDNGNYNC